MTGVLRYWQWPAAVLACAVAALPWLVVSSPFAPLAVACGAVALLVSIHHPLLVCLGFVVVTLFRLHEAYPFLMPLQLPLGFAALTAIALAFNALAGRIEAFWPTELRLFLAFFILVTVGSVFALSPGVSFAFWSTVYFKIGLMTFALAWLPRTKGDFHLVARAMALSGLLVAAVAISNKLNGTDLVEGSRVTIGLAMKSTLSDPNDLAFLLLSTLSFSIALMTGRAGWLNTLIGAVCMPMALVAIAYTQSRGAILGVLAVFATYGLLFVRSKMVLIAVVAGGAVTLYLIMGISERMAGAVQAEGLDTSAMSRIEFWGIALKAAALHPLTGVGIANFSWFNYLQTGRHMTAHNTLLQVLAEAGIPGLVLFSLMVISALRTSLRAHRVLAAEDVRSPVQPIAYALVAAIAGFCAAGFFLSQGFTWPIYVVVALAAAVGRYADANAVTQAPRFNDMIRDMVPYRG